MKRILHALLLIVTGFLIAGGGIILGYLFLISLNTSINYLYLIGSIILIPTGAFVLYQTGQKNDIFTTMPKNKIVIDVGQIAQEEGGFQQTLQKNNQINEEWTKTNEQRTKLRLLELADQAQNQK